MRPGPRRRRLAALAVAAALAACASPNPALYTVSPVPGAVHGGGPKVVVIQQIAVARYLDRSQIVRSSENNRIEVMENDWWGEPLAAMLGRVLVEELGQRLPQSIVLAEIGAVSASPDATVELNVQRLDEDASGNLLLQAQASVAFKGRGGPALRNFRFSAPPPAPGSPGEVAAVSAAMGELADGIAAMLVSAR